MTINFLTWKDDEFMTIDLSSLKDGWFKYWYTYDKNPTIYSLPLYSVIYESCRECNKNLLDAMKNLFPEEYI